MPRDHRCSDGHVRLAGAAIEEGLKRSEQGHEKSHAFASAQANQCRRELFGEIKSDMSAAVAPSVSTRTIGRKRQNGRAPGELLLPVVQVRFRHILRQGFQLPADVIGVARGHHWQRRRHPTYE